MIAPDLDADSRPSYGPDLVAKGLQEAADAFAHTYRVALVVTLITMISALFLPGKKKEEVHLLDKQQDEVPPAVMH